LIAVLSPFHCSPLQLAISEDTFRRLVGELERFNLSATGEDIKGLAFEKFLGDTFRGNLGQFFTPRSVVEFMVKLLDPAEGQLICDPAAGSGGFLIAAFEHVRAKIEADVLRAKDAKRAEIEALNLPEEEEEERINEAFAALNRELDPEAAEPPSRVHTLAHECIFGTDAEPRAAHTAKMNMIMHGDGHGGIHFHDGLLDVNGIFSGRFDLVLTNPPFGSNVGDDQKVGSSEQTRVPEGAEYLRQYKRRYGAAWEASHARLIAARNKAILELYEIGVGKANRPTELLFLERCLQLLQPGGRVGIVLPDGNLEQPFAGLASALGRRQGPPAGRSEPSRRYF
jgi:type I restriction enzyme M protein